MSAHYRFPDLEYQDVMRRLSEEEVTRLFNRIRGRSGFMGRETRDAMIGYILFLRGRIDDLEAERESVLQRLEALIEKLEQR